MQGQLNARIGRSWPLPGFDRPPAAAQPSVQPTSWARIYSSYVGALLIAGALLLVGFLLTLRIGTQVDMPAGLLDSTHSRDRPLTQTALDSGRRLQLSCRANMVR
jgi:hypothetical protein